jgi:chorismate-pyruvate lyase
MNKKANAVDTADVSQLERLVRLFFDATQDLGVFTEIAAEQIPQPQHDLLAHQQHMTVTVQQHHGCDVDLRVLASRVDQSFYARQILLTRQSDNAVVQYGIMRLDLSILDASVRAEIESQGEPLGRILIAHDVMRVVKLLSLYRIIAGPELARHFTIPPGQPCFGRTAQIFCNGSLGVELLEIV